MTDASFVVSGTVYDRASGRAAPGLRVEAWDKDTRYHDLLGAATTDELGRFRIAFGKAFFGDDDPNVLPDLFFRVFHGQDLVADTEPWVQRDTPAGEVSVVIEVEGLPPPPVDDTDGPIVVDDPGGPQPPLDGDTGAAPATSNEVVLHELGESIAAAVASMQLELTRYPNALGTFVLDEIDLTIPVRMRVDSLGQVRTTVTDGSPTAAVGQLRLRLKPVLGAFQPPVSAPQPLDSLAALSPEEIAALEAQRVYSVDDLLRVSRNAAGRVAIEQLGIGTSIDEVQDRAAVLTLPGVPTSVKEELLRVDVTKPSTFVEQDPALLAETLSGQLGRTVTTDEVAAWQDGVRLNLGLPVAEAE